MFAVKSVTVLFSMIIYACHCQRRINEGQEPKKDRGYVVYLVKAPVADVGYDTWLCGGAIVTSEFVVTSAACVIDVEFVYVVAGYRKYVPDSQIETDKCTKTMKKKVIYTCTHKCYELKHGELDMWANIDIALVKVESPFDFNDPNYETLCSYKPTTIPINYEMKYQEPGDDALVFGWGHAGTWRRPGDTQNYNQPELKYAPTMLMDKEDCMMHYKDNVKIAKTIKKYMICSLGKGNMDDEGKIIQKSIALQDGCTTGQQKLLGFEGVSCEDGDKGSSDYDDARRSYKGSNHTNNDNLTDFNNTQRRSYKGSNHNTQRRSYKGFNHTNNDNLTDFNNTQRRSYKGSNHNTQRRSYKGSNHTNNDNLTDFNNTQRRSYKGSNHTSNVNLTDFNNTQTRRYGICQNDHGGPIISWAGAREILIGVASVFKVSQDYECIGPFLYTSTFCTGIFLNCILNTDIPTKNSSRRYLCDKSPLERGFETIERTISWKNHPAGSAENENIGRTGPKPLLSPGLKYLSKNNHPLNGENENVSSNNPFQAYKIQPNVNNAPKNQEEPEPNKMYIANNSPVPVRNELKDRFKIKERAPERKNRTGKSSLPMNDRSPEKSTFLVNERNPPIMRGPGYQTHPENQRYPENQRFPVIGRFSVSEGSSNYFQKNPARMAIRPVQPLRN